MPDKDSIRARIWDRLAENELARFPFPPHGRITNFEGASEAAERAMALPELDEAEAVKANPDAPQLPLRRRLLKAGTTVYMAVPRLGEEACFVELDPASISDLDAAPTVSQMGSYGTRVGPEALPAIDAVVSGSVAVDRAGVRVGKGEGYSDLEFAILRELGHDPVPVATTVHDRQVVGDLPTDAHDLPLSLIVTPGETISVEDPPDPPRGIDWAAITEQDLDEMPVLKTLSDGA